MSRFFTHYWLNDTWEDHRKHYSEGETIDYIASNLFESRGARPGDIFYIVTVIRGQLYVAGCLTVGKICGIDEAAKILQVEKNQLWQANEFIIPSESTPLDFNLQIPVEIIHKLNFVSPDGSKKLIFKATNYLDQQTLRGVRELTKDSAALLDEILFLNQVNNLEGEQTFTIITENDESMWSDETGILYHFPKRYLKHLQTGTKVIYYKGVLKNSVYREKRMTESAHYFGTARIGKIYDDRSSNKEDKFAVIEDFQPFNNDVSIKQNGEYIEQIPESRKSNYWRDGVRKIDREIFEKILNLAGDLQEPCENQSGESISENNDELVFESFAEGSKTKKYVTTYERNPKLRKIALKIHGYDCKGCGFNFETAYGEHGKDFIHVHHLNPISEFDGSQIVNPETDMTVLCPNCHSMVHRYKTKTLSLDDLQTLINSRKL